MRAVALALAVLAAMDIPLDLQSIDQAVATANSALEQTHVRFHANYHVPVNIPPVDFVSVVTPFRRVVLAAETAQRLGRRMFGQREALAALQPDPDRVEIFVELTFHPLNTFVGVPDYSIELEPISSGGKAIAGEDIERLPRFGPRLESRWYPFPYPFAAPARAAPGSQPLTGGTMIARFAGAALDPKGIHAVVIRDGMKAGAKELARARVDFARIR